MASGNSAASPGASAARLDLAEKRRAEKRRAEKTRANAENNLLALSILAGRDLPLGTPFLATGNPDVDNNIHKFRRMKPTETKDLTQTDALRLMGLLEDKVVKTANYLNQGSSRQKLALQDLAKAVGGRGYMKIEEARAAGYKCEGNINGKKLFGIAPSDAGRFAAIADSNSQAQQSNGHSENLAMQLLASIKQTAQHHSTTQSYAEEPEKDVGDDGYNFAAMRAANGGKLPDCSICCNELGTNGAIVAYPCQDKALHAYCASCCTTMAKQWDANTCPQCKNAVGHLLFLDSTGQVVRKEALPARGKAKALSIGQVVTPALQFNNAGWYWTAPEDGSQRQSAVNARHGIAWGVAAPSGSSRGPSRSLSRKQGGTMVPADCSGMCSNCGGVSLPHQCIFSTSKVLRLRKNGEGSRSGDKTGSASQSLPRDTKGSTGEGKDDAKPRSPAAKRSRDAAMEATEQEEEDSTVSRKRRKTWKVRGAGGTWKIMRKCSKYPEFYDLLAGELAEEITGAASKVA